MKTFRTFCITLPETPERTAAAKAHFDSIGLPVEFFGGIHGEKFGLETRHTYERDNPGSGWKISAKHVGMCLSHYMLWSAMAYMPEKWFLVLENDAKFLPGWHDRLFRALNDAPQDFDMLFVGSCCCEGKLQRNIAGDVYEVKYPLCTHGYMVAKKALPILLEKQRKIYAHIDIALELDALPLLKVYAVLPRIIDQFNTKISP